MSSMCFSCARLYDRRTSNDFAPALMRPGVAYLAGTLKLMRPYAGYVPAPLFLAGIGV